MAVPPLSATLHYYHVDVAQLLILNGALAPRDNVGGGVIDKNIQLFLKGTIVSLSMFCFYPKNVYSTRSKQTKISLSSSSPLVMFQGKLGILELILKYVRNPKPQELHIFCQLICLLPTFIEDVPHEETDY